MRYCCRVKLVRTNLMLLSGSGPATGASSDRLHGTGITCGPVRPGSRPRLQYHVERSFRCSPHGGEATRGDDLAEFRLASLSAEWRGYQGPDAFVSSAVTRFDHVYDAKLTYGIPLDTIVPIEAARGVLKDLVVTLFVDYQYDASTVPNYDWRAWRAGGLVTKSIRF